jgi:hypothetical protein
MNTEALSAQLPPIPPYLAAWILLDELTPDTLRDISEQIRAGDWSRGTRQEWRERLASRIERDGMPFSSVFDYEFDETLEPYFQRLFSRESRVSVFLSSSKLLEREERSVSFALNSLGVKCPLFSSPNSEAIARQVIRSALNEAREAYREAAYMILEEIDHDPENPNDLNEEFNRSEESRAKKLMRLESIEGDLEILAADVYLPAMAESEQFFPPASFLDLVREVYADLLAERA